MEKTISLHGSYYPNNFGDVLILAIQAQWIREITGKEVALPFATAVYRDTICSSSLKGIKALKNSSKLVYGAGGYLGEPLVKKWKWGFRNLKNHAIPAEYALLNKKKFAIIGPGVGPITNYFTRKEIIRICKKSSVLAVRDDESKEYLKEYGVPETKINVTSDVALTLKKSELPNWAREKSKNLFKKIDGYKYGIHIGTDFNSSTYGGQTRILVEECIDFLNNNEDITPVIIIDNDNVQQNKSANYIIDNVKRKCLIHKYKNIWETVAVLGDLDFVLTNKLHVGIVAYTLGAQCLSFPYHPKTQRFYKQIGEEEWCVPLLDITHGSVATLLDKSLDKDIQNNWKANRNEKYPILLNLANRNKELLCEFLLS